MHQIWQLQMDIGHLLIIKLSIDSCLFLEHVHISLTDSNFNFCLALGSITGSQLVLWLLQRSFYTIRILNFYMYLLNRPITLNLLVMAEPPISQQLCKIAAVNKLPRSIQSRIYSNKTICSIWDFKKIWLLNVKSWGK